jgi:NitT/TauT family transport system substrate-binding protein
MEKEELNGRKVYIQHGIVYWEYLKTQYDLSKIEELGYTGQHVSFISDVDSVTQSFVTSEPYLMKLEGIDVETKRISDAGYKPFEKTGNGNNHLKVCIFFSFLQMLWKWR